MGLYKEIINKGIGNNRTISISKTRKITARRKNRNENGMRALALGSKPHSNGEDFSRSSIERNEITNANSKTINGINKEVNKDKSEIIISLRIIIYYFL